MAEGARIIRCEPGKAPVPEIEAVIGAIGLAGFDARFGDLVLQSCGADICAVFRIAPEGATSVVATTASRPHEFLHSHTARYATELHWRHDPALAPVLKGGVIGPLRQGEQPHVVQIDPTRIENVVLKREFYGPAGIGDKLAIASWREDALYIVSLLRTLEHGRFPDSAIRQAGSLAGTLIALAASHARLIGQPPSASALASVEVIEQKLDMAEQGPSPWRLTNRERQVCARILYGVGAIGIALDLGISECSVDTYRKRAYRRLGIATRHELLRLYLALAAVPARLH